MTVQIRYQDSKIKEYNVERRFENGYGAIVDFNNENFVEEQEKIIYIIITSLDGNYKNKKIELGYEIIDGNEEYIREVNIMEHIYGMTEKSETCYNIKDRDISELNGTIMLINIFSQSLEFNIKNAKNEKLYSLDVYNNYFIRFPNITMDSKNKFCLKYITPKDEKEEKYGEVSYDFQIYFENELYKNQMFIIPLINGKIYTHSLNKGDVIIYRQYYNANLTEDNEKVIYSANMLNIKGNPKLYGFTCEQYPHNCNVDINKLKNDNFDKIEPLNIYNVNKKLNTPKDIDINGESVYEQRKQYLTIVSCDKADNDSNNDECIYTIEINNERDEIQLIPETVFATGIYNPINYFSIKLSDYSSLKYLKIYFTILIGNAELYIYEDSDCKNEIESYKFSHIHRKEIIEISKNLQENYFIIIKCEDISFIQLKYETDKHYKGYTYLIPNEINIEPIIKDMKSYFNINKIPFKEKSHNYLFKVLSMDCSMTCGNATQSYENITDYYFETDKNKSNNNLSNYDFYSQVYNFFHTSFDEENCGINTYNEERINNKPFFVISDMPHISSSEHIEYVYPIIFDENNDNGVLIEFKINANDKTYPSKTNLYSYSYRTSGMDSQFSHIIENDYYALYINKDFYKNSLKDNPFGLLYIVLEKQEPYGDYYISTNFISSKISPEYIYSQKNYKLSLRPSSSKYYYFQIDADSKGHIEFSYPENELIEIYAKIVKKNKIEPGYNWNKRVKLPDENDTGLMRLKGIIEYKSGDTLDCYYHGCELYFQIKSK